MVELIERLGMTLKLVGIRVPPVLYLFVGIVFPISLGLFLFPVGGPVTSALFILVIVDLFFGVPYYLVQKKVDTIETVLPDVLRHMSTTISSGSTLEYALADISKSDYKVFSDEAEYLLRDLKAGDTFEHTFTMFAFRYNSKLLQRAAKIIIAAKQAGAGLVDTLEAIAEDIRQLKMIYRERRASTMMQVTFLIMAGVIIAPAISAFALSLVSHLSESGLEQAETIDVVLTQIDGAVQFYILFECASIALAISIMREGKVSPSVLYMPFFLIGGYVIFIVGKALGIALIGGMA